MVLPFVNLSPWLAMASVDIEAHGGLKLSRLALRTLRSLWGVPTERALQDSPKIAPCGSSSVINPLPETDNGRVRGRQAASEILSSNPIPFDMPTSLKLSSFCFFSLLYTPSLSKLVAPRLWLHKHMLCSLGICLWFPWPGRALMSKRGTARFRHRGLKYSDLAAGAYYFSLEQAS